MSIFRSITARLVAAELIFVVLPFSLMGWFMVNALNQFYLNHLQDDMTAEAGLLAQIVAPDISGNERLETQYLLDKMPSPVKSQMRVFIFDNQGHLIGSTDSSLSDSLGSTLAEPGVETGTNGQTARGVEISAATGMPIAYVTQPILNNGQIIGVVHLSYSLQQISDAQFQLRLLIIGVVFLTGLIACVFSWQLARGLRQPLARLSTATAIIAGGDLAHRVPENMPTELAELVRNFNQMTESLQKAETARQHSFANIAHDVRTPLGSIRAALEALDGGALDQPELRAQLVTGLFEQLNYLRRLTDGLLRLASYESHGPALNLGRVNLACLLQQVVGIVEPQAAECHVKLRVEIAPGLPEIWADADRICEALFNLLDNAFRYATSGGQVWVLAEPEPDNQAVTVHVRDTGVGIHPTELQNVFDRYWQGDYRRQGNELNLGLGLSIVQEIIAAQGGKVGVCNLSNAGEAGGADFYFTLPVATSARMMGLSTISNC